MTTGHRLLLPLCCAVMGSLAAYAQIVPTTVNAGTNPNSVAVNPVTNKIYVANSGSANVTVIDGATNSTTTVNAGTIPVSIAVNPVTNKIYVANFTSTNVTVTDGSTNSPTPVTTGTNPNSVAVNPVTNKIYVSNFAGNNATVIDGATKASTTVNTGTGPASIDVNPVTNNIYVANQTTNDVTVIDEQQVQAIPLRTLITALAGNQTTSSTPSFTFNAQSTFSPIAPAIGNVFFQVDTWQGPWTTATGTGPSFTGTVAALQPGFHILYAYAGDGQEATSEQAVSPLIGSIAAYGFLVVNQPSLSVTKTHTGNFTQGQVGATYTVTVSNGGSAGTTGTVTVTETAPTGLTVTSMSGGGWICNTATCTRGDALAGGQSYPAIFVTVNVAGNASSPQLNQVSASGGGSATASASDSTIIASGSQPALSIAKTHTGNFAQGQQGATYTLTVSNTAGAATTNGTVTVTDMLPSGLPLVSMAARCWGSAAHVCTRGDALAGGSPYTVITVTDKD